MEQEAYLNLWRTYDRLKVIEEEVFAPVGISPQQYNTLRLLKAVSPQGLTVQGIGDRLISRAPDMTRLLDRLEDRGWVARVRRSDNRRVVDVTLTASGRALLEELAAKVRECHHAQLGHLTPEQLQALIDILGVAREPHEGPGSVWASPAT
ncbi:MAG: MarR family transcriptional regulator [Planctomycetales bacterium 12-60-4]|nr:MAG: MarR family transcriptional regulator [Planctomycetales bacterium 12-60-4]